MKNSTHAKESPFSHNTLLKYRIAPYIFYILEDIGNVGNTDGFKRELDTIKPACPGV